MLIYLVCIAVIGVPIMMAEIMLGRRGRQSPINTMHTLAIEAGHNPHWKWLGWLGVAAGFLILSYYSVIAGWSLAYIFRTATGTFTGVTPDGVGSIFGSFLSDSESLLFWHTVFMVMTMLVVARGVAGGLEKAVKFLMPALFVILIILLGYAMNTAAFDEGIRFLFEPDFHALLYSTNEAGVERLSWNPVLIAMGHAFFTLSLGMGAIMVYGSYLPQDASIAKTTFMIAGADTAVALIAGMVIFPIVFANGLEPGSGPGLIFQTLPLAFGHMPGGIFFGTLFFILLSFAAWSSSISLIEPAVAWLVENRNMDRMKAAVIMGIACWLFGLTLGMQSCSYYKVDIRQGNTLDQETVDSLRVGMTKQQVIFLMGTPLLQDPFHANRWNYVYTFQPGGGEMTSQHVWLQFEGDQLTKIDKSGFKPEKPVKP